MAIKIKRQIKKRGNVRHTSVQHLLHQFGGRI